MEYKVGDKVIIRKDVDISLESRKIFEKSNYIMTIREFSIVNETIFGLEGIPWLFQTYIIKELYKEDPIKNRFELLDIRRD